MVDPRNRRLGDTGWAGGHSELHLLLGVGIAGLCTRFLGLFERRTIYC